MDFRIVFFLSLTFFNDPFNSFAQEKFNYYDKRSEFVKSTCSTVDIEIEKLDLSRLQMLDTNLITKGLSQYYYDLGMIYSNLSRLDKEFENLKPLKYQAFKRCVELDKRNGNAYLNLSISYYFDKDIELAKKYAQLHKKHSSKKERDIEYLNMIENK